MRKACTLLCLVALLRAACGSASVSRPLEPEPVAQPQASPATARRATMDQRANGTPVPVAAPQTPKKLRVFVVQCESDCWHGCEFISVFFARRNWLRR